MIEILGETTSEIKIPIEWILGIIAIMGSVVATLATTIWKLVTNRLRAQDEIIRGLRKDVDRLTKGCGVKECIWRGGC